MRIEMQSQLCRHSCSSARDRLPGHPAEMPASRLPTAGPTPDFQNQLKRIHRLLVTPTAKVIPESAAERPQ